MNNKIFIPKKIKVGYQNRSDTYTGKLAYVIYYDEKGKLRKQTSWESWRNDNIEPSDYDNEPTSGFVLNKKAGGDSCGWNHRQTYCRVYDPRGFEFEITIPNLLYILDNCNSIKGKGLEGNFVYGWDGTDLLLVPEDSPDYKALMSLSEVLYENKKFNASNMIIGATYLTKQNEKWVYLGRYHLYDDNEWRYDKLGKDKGLYYFFSQDGLFMTIKSTDNKIVDIVSEDYVNNYSDLMDKLEHKAIYSPHDHYEYVEVTENDDFDSYCYLYFIVNGEYIRFYGRTLQTSVFADNLNTAAYFNSLGLKRWTTTGELLSKTKLYKRVQILKNGNIGE